VLNQRILDLLDGELRRAKAMHPAMPQEYRAWIGPIAEQFGELVFMLKGAYEVNGKRVQRTMAAIHVMAIMHRLLDETEMMRESGID
jgi:hypothetical protein